MKVENPRFNSVASVGTVRCNECPFTDANGNIRRGYESVCDGWGINHDKECPTPETYAAACEMAEGRGE